MSFIMIIPSLKKKRRKIKHFLVVVLLFSLEGNIPAILMSLTENLKLCII